MAFSAKQIEELQNDKAKGFAGDVEKWIDDFLTISYQKYERSYTINLRDVWSNLGVPHGEIRIRVVAEISPRYAQVGWKLSYENKYGYLMITRIEE